MEKKQLSAEEFGDTIKCLVDEFVREWTICSKVDHKTFPIILNTVDDWMVNLEFFLDKKGIKLGHFSFKQTQDDF